MKISMIFLCSFITHDDKYAYIDDIDEVFYSRVDDNINQSSFSRVYYIDEVMKYSIREWISSINQSSFSRV
jgi:hypothetical protein